MTAKITTPTTRVDSHNAAAPLGEDESLPESAGDDRYLVPALIRGIEVLKVFTRDQQRFSLTEIAAALGVTRSAAYRFVYTLDHLRLLTYDAATRTYQLGSSVLSLGYNYLSSRDIVSIALPHLESLRDATTWSAHLGELDGTEVIYLARAATRRSLASSIQVGSRLPAHATGMGRVLLSGLKKAELIARYNGTKLESFAGPAPTNAFDLYRRAQRDAAAQAVIQVAGFETGVASVAAPVRDISGAILAAINVSLIVGHYTNQDLRGEIREQVIKNR